jgi:hypothetical protein
MDVVDFVDVVDNSGFLANKKASASDLGSADLPDVRIIRQQSNDQRFTEAKALYRSCLVEHGRVPRG